MLKISKDMALLASSKLVQMFCSINAYISARYPDDVVAHTALGFFLLAQDSDQSEQNVSKCERAASVFRRARAVSKGGEQFVPAMRGLAVALRRRSLMAGGAISMHAEHGSGRDSAQVGESRKSLSLICLWWAPYCKTIAWSRYRVSGTTTAERVQQNLFANATPMFSHVKEEFLLVSFVSGVSLGNSVN